MSAHPPTHELPSRQDRVRDHALAQGSEGERETPSDSARVRTEHPKGVWALLDALTRAEFRGVLGAQLSAFTVMALSVLAICAWLIPGGAWTFGAVIGCAGLALVCGWSALTGIDLPAATTLVLAGTSILLPVVVAATGDLGNAAPILGIAVVATLAATIFSAPSPRDHTLPQLRSHTAHAPSTSASVLADDSLPLTTPPPSAGSRSRSTASQAPSVAVSRRRATPEVNARPTTLAFASAISLLVLIGGGSAWSTINVLENWGVLVPITSAIVALVVWGDQIGRSFRTQSASALTIGVLTGIATSLLSYWLGRATLLLPIILPEVAESVGRPVAFSIIGVTAGTAVALAVIVLDGLLGDHVAQRRALGAVARGAAKFLIAAIPIYTLVRIGGL